MAPGAFDTMTDDFDATRYQRTLERWRVLADRRLEHMTLLYESGRWRRYFTEEKFLDVVRETKAASEKWHRLAPIDGHEALLALAAEQAVEQALLPSPLVTVLPELELSVA